MIFRVQDFFRTGETGFLHHPHVHLADGGNARQHVFLSFRIGLMQHAFITDADGPGLVRINPGDQHQFVFNFFLHAGQTVNVVQHRIFVIGGTGADYQNETVIRAGKNILDFFVSCGFYG